MQLAGTKYFPSYHDRILILETPEGDSVNSTLPYEQARSLIADFVNLRVFEVIAGLVIGRPFKYDERQKKASMQMVLDRCYGTNFPILFSVDIGHTDPILTIPLNAMASLDSAKDEFAILDAAVVENRHVKKRYKFRTLIS